MSNMDGPLVVVISNISHDLLLTTSTNTTPV